MYILPHKDRLREHSRCPARTYPVLTWAPIICTKPNNVNNCSSLTCTLLQEGNLNVFKFFTKFGMKPPPSHWINYLLAKERWRELAVSNLLSSCWVQITDLSTSLGPRPLPYLLLEVSLFNLPKGVPAKITNLCFASLDPPLCVSHEPAKPTTLSLASEKTLTHPTVPTTRPCFLLITRYQ